MSGSTLKSKVASGEITIQDEVRLIGTNEWTLIGNLPKLVALVPSGSKEKLTSFDEARGGNDNWKSNVSKKEFSFQATAEIEEEIPRGFFLLPSALVSSLVKFLKSILSGSLFLSRSNDAESTGHLLLMVGIPLIGTAGLILAIKTDSISLLLEIVGWIVALCIAQYTSWRSLIASRRLLSTTPTSIQNTFVLDIAGVVFAILGCATLVISVVIAVKINNYSLILSGICAFAIFELSASLAFSPSSCNMNIGSTSSGEEAIGLMSFFLKILLLLGPFVYFVASLGGCVIVSVSLYNLTINAEERFLQGVIQFESAKLVFVAGGFYPVVFYLIFLVYYLFIDVFRSILQIGNDVRKISNQKE
ncbi:hypothetical protein H8D29_00245 [PVC group bacterium]|nr:hypothetical protein [PVC group bacterium]